MPVPPLTRERIEALKQGEVSLVGKGGLLSWGLGDKR